MSRKVTTVIYVYMYPQLILSVNRKVRFNTLLTAFSFNGKFPLTEEALEYILSFLRFCR